MVWKRVQKDLREKLVRDEREIERILENRFFGGGNNVIFEIMEIEEKFSKFVNKE